jgi:hypothetical protein
MSASVTTHIDILIYHVWSVYIIKFVLYHIYMYVCVYVWCVLYFHVLYIKYAHM